MERSQQVHELLCRTRDSVRVIRGISAQENVCFASPGFVCQFSRCGTKLALVDLNGLKILRTSDYTEIMFSRRANVQLLHFSNCGRYLVSWEKPQEENPNLILWDTLTSTALYQFFQKQSMKELWPTLVFSSDSTHFFTRRGDSLCTYRIPEQQPVSAFTESKVSSFFVSPQSAALVIYAGDSRGDGSKLCVYSQQAGALAKVVDIATRYVQEIKVLWNKDGTRALIWCQTDVDTTGRSYYGEHSLYIYTPESCRGRVHRHLRLHACYYPLLQHERQQKERRGQTSTQHHSVEFIREPFPDRWLRKSAGRCRGV